MTKSQVPLYYRGIRCPPLDGMVDDAVFFFFNDSATTEIYTLSLHDALPISFADEARSEGRLALDTEFIWERTYAPIPCLVQVATADRLAVIDPLEGGDVDPIAQLVADPEVELLMHAPSGDLLDRK